MGMVLVRTTVGHERDARAMARRLVEAAVACCVHVVPIQSTYRWDGRVQEEAEWLVEARALERDAARLEEAVAAGHPYDVPLVERVASDANAAYAAWAASVT